MNDHQTTHQYSSQRKLVMKWLMPGICLSLALALNGALPFVSLSTLGQSVLVVGYPISFINDGILTLHPVNMGFPSDNPMTTMLAPSLIMEIFLLVGIFPADAFALSHLTFITFGFYGAYSLARRFDVPRPLAGLHALLWFCFPIVWASSGYSHLQFGFSWLPFAMYSCVLLLDAPRPIDLPSKLTLYLACLVYFLATLVMAFTDGYCFVIFALAASLIIGCNLLFRVNGRRKIVFSAALVHVLSFAASYLLYSTYIGKSEFESDSLNFFRGWGLDITYALWPTRGMHWFWDVLGLSEVRTEAANFGDASVWMSTFMLPALLLAIYHGIKVKSKLPLFVGMFAAALVGFYLALGPSLKLNTHRPEGMSRGIPDGYLSVSTGTAYLSSHVPGFKNMRASYRWVGLSYFGLWGIILIGMASQGKQKGRMDAVLLSTTILLYLPNLPNHLSSKHHNREMFKHIESDLVAPMKKDFHAGEIIAFAPYGNDFLSNYLAPRVNFISYNVGGDKNVESAIQHWPATLRDLPKSHIDNTFGAKILHLLAKDDVDTVVIPYIDLLNAAHNWPSPLVLRDTVLPTEEYLRASGLVQVQVRPFYSVIRLNSRSLEARRDGRLDDMLPPCALSKCDYKDATALSHFTKVGKLREGRLIATENPGYLFFGPYGHFGKGDYRISLDASIPKASDAHLDIVSKKGTQTHLIIDLGSYTGDIKNIPFTLAADVSDLEVRMVVGANTGIIVSSYSIEPREISRTISTESISSKKTGPIDCGCTASKLIMKRSQFTTGSTPSSAGRIANGVIRTDGTRGYLLFGPYQPLEPGRYCVEVVAAVNHSGGAFVDVVSDSGKTIIASTPLRSTQRDQHFGFQINQDLKDAEVRAFVTEKSKLKLVSISLSPECFSASN